MNLSILLLTAFFLLPASARASVIIQRPLYIGLTDGLVGFWSFDGPDVVKNGIRLTAYDRSGQGKHATSTDANGGTVTFSRVQSATGEANPASATFSLTPTQGNLLVAIALERSGTSEADFTITGSGWTKRIGHDAELADVDARRTLVVWTKTAGANEPTNIQVDNGTSNTIKLMIQEFSAWVTDPGWTFEDAASNDTGTGSASPLSTGTTGSVSAGDLLVTAVAGWRNQTGDPGSIAWTNGVANTLESLGGNSGRSINTGFVQKSSGGTKESAVSWSGSGHEASAGILVFSAGTKATSTAPKRVAGRLGQGLDFDGDFSHLIMGDVGSGIRTISFWMRGRDVTSEKIIGIDGNALIETNGSDQIVATNFSAASVYVDGVAASAVSDNVWHHIVITDTTGVSGSAFELGQADGGYFNGMFDDVRIYNRALSPTEIKRLYNMRQGIRIKSSGTPLTINKTLSTGSLEDGLVGHWSFDGPDGLFGGPSFGYLTAPDMSGNGNKGVQNTVANMPNLTIGRLGQGLKFDGSDDYIAVAAGESLAPPNALAVSIWIRPAFDLTPTFCPKFKGFYF